MTHPPKKIAILHDSLCVPGGAERLTLALAHTFPDAPIYTSVYLPEQTFPEFKNYNVHSLPNSKFVHSERQFKLFYLLWLAELQHVHFSEYDLVLSSSTYLAKYIRPAAGVTHKAYIHAPFRFLWKPESYSDSSLPTPKALTELIKLFLPVLRRIDLRETQKIPYLATNSLNMAHEIKKIYQREATVIHPPISLKAFPLRAEPGGNYYITVSRLISHKRIDLAIQACNSLRKRLIVVGDGPEKKKLEQIAGDTIHFTGRMDDRQLLELYSGAKALIFPSYEDYGIVPLEAQACGKPVIAFGKGGALETIQDQVSGIYFKEQSVESLIDGILRFEKMRFWPEQIWKWAGQFDESIFSQKMIEFVYKE